MTLTRKRKALLASAIAIAIVLVIAVPLVSAQSSSAVGNVKELNARGFAYQKVDNQTVKTQANFTLALQPTIVNGTIKRFDVTGGTVVVNGVSYTISSGNGAVLTGRHTILLQAQGTSPTGQAVTLKLEGRYFWMGGHLYVARIAAKLQTDSGNYGLLMRAAIRV